MKLSISVVITTRFGAPWIINTVKSLRSSLHVKNFPIIVVNGGGNFTSDTKKQLKRSKVEIIEIKEQGSILEKAKIGIKNCNSDIVVLTQDDVSFAKTTLKQIVDSFDSNKSLTMVCTKVAPKEHTNLLQQTLSMGMDIVNSISLNLNDGDNYLSVNGRCIAIKRTFLKKFRFPSIVNVDAFLYFENKLNGGEYKYLKNAPVYLKVPKELKDHLKQSKRFQGSFDELKKLFGEDIKNEYQISYEIKIKSILSKLIENPFFVICYLIITVYTRFWITQKNKKEAQNPNWSIDVSTK